MSSICQFSQGWDVPFLLLQHIVDFLFSAQLSPWLLFCSIAAFPVISYFTLEFSFLSRTLIYWFCLYQSNSSICQDHFCLSSCPLGSLQDLSAWLYQQILCIFSIISSKVLQLILNKPHAWKTPRGALVMLSEFDSKQQFTAEMLHLPESKTYLWSQHHPCAQGSLKRKV